MSVARYPSERSAGVGGGWNLPGVRDLLNPQEQQQSPASELPARQSSYEPRYEKTYPRTQPLQLHIITQTSTRRPSTSYNPGPSPMATSAPSPAFSTTQHSPPSHYVLSAPPAHAYQSPQRPQQTPQGLHGMPYYSDMPQRPRMMSTVSNTSAIVNGQPLTAARIASNHRHKTSEKQRRDGNGSLTQAGHVLRNGMSPALLFNCSTCAASTDSEGSNQSHLPTPQSSFSSALQSNQTLEPKPKIPKNDILYHSILWEFDVILHNGTPEMVREKVDGVRALAMSMEEEKLTGLKNSLVNKDGRTHKWSSDVRGEVLFGVIQRMETSCREHGIAIGEERDMVSRWREVVGDTAERKRQRDDDEAYEEDARFVKRSQSDVPTPPSSRSSPIL